MGTLMKKTRTVDDSGEKEDLLRIALVGCGAIVQHAYAPLLASPAFQGRVRVVAVCDPAGERAAEVLNHFPGARGFRGVEELEADLAIVASPAAFHSEQSVVLLRRGMHVLCEKPMARTSAESDAMNSAARDAGRTLAVGLFRRFFPALEWVKRAIELGTFGAVRRIELREGGRFNWPAASPSFFKRETAGGGVLLDVGVHVLDTLIWWMGEPNRVEYFDDNMGGVEGNALIRCDFVAGAEAEVRLSWDSSIRTGYRIEFERAVVELGPGDPHSVNIKLGGENTLLRLDGTLARPISTLPLCPSLPVADYGQAFALQLEDVLESVRAKREPRVTGIAAAASVALIERCYSKRQVLPESWSEEWEFRGPEVGDRRSEAGRPNKEPRTKNQEPRTANGAEGALRIAVIGASGFVGTRMVEMLGSDPSIELRPIVRSAASLARIARFPLDWRIADATSIVKLSEALRGCDMAVDLTLADGPAIGPMASSVYRACERANIKRLIYMSSASVHGQNPLPGTDEISPLSAKGKMAYSRGKIAAELTLRRLSKRGSCELAILRPGIVWGPRSRWVEELAVSLTEDRAYWVEGGRGIANLIYVDNLVRSVVAAVSATLAGGSTYHLNDPGETCWRDFYLAIGEGLGFGEDAFHDVAASAKPAGLQPLFERVRVHPATQRIAPLVPGVAKRLVKGAVVALRTPELAGRAWLPPAQASDPGASGEISDLHRCSWRFATARADQCLGALTLTSFGEGVTRSVAWLRWLGYGQRGASAVE